MKEVPEHLKGLRIPSLDDIAEHALRYIGTGTLDLSVVSQRKKLRTALVWALSCEVRSLFRRALQKATARAIDHVFAISNDPNYQDARKKQRLISAQHRRENRAKIARSRELERETQRQSNKGLIQ